MSLGPNGRGRGVVVAGAVRTAIGKFGGGLAGVHVADMGAVVAREAMKRAGLAEASAIDETIVGHARQAGNGPNVGRQVAHFAGVPDERPAYTINMACSSGMQAIVSGAQAVALGDSGVVLTAGVENMSRIPFLLPDQQKVYKWDAILKTHGDPRKARIGISWAGGLKKTRFDQRSMELKRWADILRTPNVEWYSLQYHAQAADEAADVGRELGIPIHHWGDAVGADNCEDLAGFMANLDLVITVNTSLLHLAGALGVPTWCLTPVMCAWRYQCSGPNPWYGSVEMFRQEKSGEWKPVLDEVAMRLMTLQAMTAREAA